MRKFIKRQYKCDNCKTLIINSIKKELTICPFCKKEGLILLDIVNPYLTYEDYKKFQKEKKIIQDVANEKANISNKSESVDEIYKLIDGKETKIS